MWLTCTANFLLVVGQARLRDFVLVDKIDIFLSPVFNTFKESVHRGVLFAGLAIPSSLSPDISEANVVVRLPDNEQERERESLDAFTLE